MSKFSNLIRLLILLKSNGRMKSKDISVVLGISERMVRKYINDLIEAGVEVISITGPSGGYEIKGYDYLLNINISKGEIAALEILYEGLNHEEHLQLSTCIRNIIDKLKIQNSNLDNMDKFDNNIVLNSNVMNIRKQNNIELSVQKGILLNKKIDMEYISINKGLSRRVIHPYEIINRNNLKYVVAYCEKRQEIRLFKLVRMHNLIVLDENFEKIEDVTIKELYDQPRLGVIMGEDIELKLLIKPPFSYSVSERIYTSNQRIFWNVDDSIIFEGTLNGREDIIRWILSMKSCVTVISPNELKVEIKQELMKMINNI